MKLKQNVPFYYKSKAGKRKYWTSYHKVINYAQVYYHLDARAYESDLLQELLHEN